jgi:heavy metal sensor kinase
VESGTEWGGRRYRVLAMASLESVAGELRTVRRVLLLALPVLLLIAGAGGFALARASLRPLDSMAEQARHIGDRNLHKRIEVAGAGEELQVLATAFNGLLARLDASFDTMRRFVADASHELRTPIAIIRGEAEVALAQDRQPREYRESLAIIQDEAGRLTRLVDDLLNLARADAGHVRMQTSEFYLNDLLAECCRSVQNMAAAAGVTVECRCLGDVSFHGDEQLLRRLVLNLLDNAIRYTPPNGSVRVELETGEGELCVVVADTGMGIPADAAPHVFERFYRADGSRSRNEGGFGLGLSIVKWIAESHGGAVDLASTPGEGSTFTVRLPRRA